MKTVSRSIAKTLMSGVLALSATLAFGACDPSEIVEVSIVDMRFVPAHIEVCDGQTVRWTNNETANTRRPIAHTVTADVALAQNPANILLPEGADSFNSEFLTPGQTFEHTFTVSGIYRYICIPHEVMGHLGTVTVLSAE